MFLDASEVPRLYRVILKDKDGDVVLNQTVYLSGRQEDVNDFSGRIFLAGTAQYGELSSVEVFPA